MTISTSHSFARSRTRIMTVALYLSLLSIAGGNENPIFKGAEFSYVAYKNIPYAEIDEGMLSLDLYVPQGVTSPPLFVWIHGGSWQGGTRSEVPPLSAVLREGFALASISYRFSQVAPFPAQIHDCKGAVRWLRAHQQRFGYNAGFIAVAGSSAGGMLAALLSTSGGEAALEGETGGNLDQSSRVQLGINYFGASDFLLRAKTQPGATEKPGSVVYRLLGGSVAENPALARLASAVEHIDNGDPPLMVFHGGLDKTVLPDQSKRLVNAYEESGLPVEFIFIPDGKHQHSPYFNKDNTERMITFLKQHLSAFAELQKKE